MGPALLLALVLSLSVSARGVPPAAEARARVVAMFRHAWAGYAVHAWGHDEVRPTSNATNDSWGGFGVVAVDGLDTALLMGLEALVLPRTLELVRATQWDRDWPASVFEYTIRYVGGLLGAYELCGESVLLDQAEALARRMAPAYVRSPSGLPFGVVNLRTGSPRTAGWLRGRALLAEAGSVQLEGLRLSQLRPHAALPYGALAQRAMSQLLAARPNDTHLAGLFPVYATIATGLFDPPYSATTGALSDSFYEVLFKQWLLEGKQPQSPLLSAWREAWAGLQSRLLLRSQGGHAFFGELDPSGSVQPTMDHMSCHMPGLLALAHAHDTGADRGYLRVARDVADTCWHLYQSTATGLGPERVRFRLPGEPAAARDFEVEDAKYILRPEAVESFFVLWRVTRDEVWRERAWAVVERLDAHCRTAAAYSGLADVNRARSVELDTMQSFFLAETLKYLFLIFDDSDRITLHSHVFTTEAHAFRLP